jgi:deoxycytidylate deaminase
MKKFKNYINLAIETAIDNNSRFKLCAITLDKKNRLIALAKNDMNKTHPMCSKIASSIGKPYIIYIHAESGALMKSDLNAHTLIVVRVKKNGGLANAKPCKVCEKFIEISNVKNVIYSNKYGKLTHEER